MNDKPADPEARKQQQMAETIRLVVTTRERAPRSPRLERALKQLLWRYSRALQAAHSERSKHAPE